MTWQLSLSRAWGATVVLTASARADDGGEALGARLARELEAARYGGAVVMCEGATHEVERSLALRAQCAQAYLGLGDRLAATGANDAARARWQEAVSLDPRLADDATFMARFAPSSPTPPVSTPNTRAPTPPVSTPDTRAPTPPSPRPHPRAATPRDPLGAHLGDAPAPTHTRTPAAPKGPPPNAGPRWDRGFGIGLSFGFDGLAALSIGWLADETILAEVTVGIAYPTADVRVRWLGLRHCVTPFVGIGVIVPFGSDDRLGLDVDSYKRLYALGEAFHLDLGLAYTPVEHLDLYAGITFLTPFDQSHPDTVLFFPQFTGGVSWYF